MGETLGIYISVPFCAGKCTFCNFASDAFAPGLMPEYLQALGGEIARVRLRAREMGAELPERVDTIYLGGGTPSLLGAEEARALFQQVRSEFHVAADAEITVECAPGQIADATLEAFLEEGVSRVSLGVQSFVDSEAAAVGRRHTGEGCRQEINRLRSRGLEDVGVDLIAGLPGQTAASWDRSLRALLESGATHGSVYLLELDEDSRLGREALRGGTRYGAAHLPDEEETTAMYERACAILPGSGLEQYEISNFAREDRQSRHNTKYWRRAPYLGFGLDAHSMLPCGEAGELRFANAGELARYLQGQENAFPMLPSEDDEDVRPRLVSARERLEEALFLGLRMVEGVGFQGLPGTAAERAAAWDALQGAADDGLVELAGDRVRLTGRGRLLSNEVFGRLLELEPA